MEGVEKTHNKIRGNKSFYKLLLKTAKMLKIISGFQQEMDYFDMILTLRKQEGLMKPMVS